MVHQSRQGVEYDTKWLAGFVGESKGVDSQNAAKSEYVVKGFCRPRIAMDSFGHKTEVFPPMAVGFREVVLVVLKSIDLLPLPS